MATHFKFKLESLLRHRQFVEDSRQKEFAAVDKRLMEARQAESRLREKHLRLAKELEENMQAPHPVSESGVYVTYLKCLSDQIEKQQEKVQAVALVHLEKKTALLKAIKKRKTLERLKENQADQYHRSYLKKEQQVSDEIGIQQYRRKRLG